MICQSDHDRSLLWSFCICPWTFTDVQSRGCKRCCFHGSSWASSSLPEDFVLGLVSICWSPLSCLGYWQKISNPAGGFRSYISQHPDCCWNPWVIQNIDGSLKMSILFRKQGSSSNRNKSGTSRATEMMEQQQHRRLLPWVEQKELCSTIMKTKSSHYFTLLHHFPLRSI